MVVNSAIAETHEEGSERTAQCFCGKEVPSNSRRLPFFKDLSQPDPNICGVCNYFQVAHERWSGRLMDTVSAGRWPSHIAQHEFVPQAQGQAHDSFYCGCRGWD